MFIDTYGVKKVNRMMMNSKTMNENLVKKLIVSVSGSNDNELLRKKLENIHILNLKRP